MNRATYPSDFGLDLRPQGVHRALARVEGHQEPALGGATSCRQTRAVDRCRSGPCGLLHRENGAGICRVDAGPLRIAAARIRRRGRCRCARRGAGRQPASDHPIRASPAHRLRYAESRGDGRISALGAELAACLVGSRDPAASANAGARCSRSLSVLHGAGQRPPGRAILRHRSFVSGFRSGGCDADGELDHLGLSLGSGSCRPSAAASTCKIVSWASKPKKKRRLPDCATASSRMHGFPMPTHA